METLLFSCLNFHHLAFSTHLYLYPYSTHSTHPPSPTPLFSQGLPMLRELLTATELNLLLSVLNAIRKFVCWAYDTARARPTPSFKLNGISGGPERDSDDPLQCTETALRQAGLPCVMYLLPGSPLREQIGLLANHPYHEVATHAAELDNMLERFGD